MLYAAHALAVLAALVSSLPWWGKSLLAGAIFGHLRYSSWRHLQEPACSGLLYEADRGWRLGLNSGAWLAVQVLSSSVVTPWFVVLHLQTGAGRRAWLIVRDSLPSEDFRRLRVYLRLQVAQSGDPLT